MTSQTITVPEDLREKLLLSLNDDPHEHVQDFLDILRRDTLADFRQFTSGLGNTSPTERAMRASWWFIENVAEDDWRRNEIFFELRSLVRHAFAEKPTAKGKPPSYIRFECGREDRFSEKLGPFEFVQATYGTLRVGPDGEREIARFNDGLWHSDDGQTWSDVVIFSEEPRG